jgi:hypothetical protein
MPEGGLWKESPDGTNGLEPTRMKLTKPVTAGIFSHSLSYRLKLPLLLEGSFLASKADVTSYAASAQWFLLRVNSGSFFG